MAHISKIYGSLVKRILGVLVVLVIIPLSIDALLLARRDKKIKHSAAMSQLNLMERSFAISVDSFISEGKLLLAGPIVGSNGLAQYTFDENLVCTASTIDVMVGKGDFFPNELKGAAQTGQSLFIGLNPFTGVDEIFLFESQGDTLRGLSISETRFLNRMQSLHPFEFDLVNRGAPGEGPLIITRPYPGSNFSLRVSITKDAVSKLEGAGVYHHLFVLMGIILTVGGLGTIWLIMKMARPLSQLAYVMEGVGNQDISLRYTSDPFGFEINNLGKRFNHMLDSLLRHMEEAKNERIHRERLSKELEIGHAIQQELLPDELPTMQGIEIAGRFVSAKEVAGDFYDLYPLSESTLFFAIADGSDKGISACLYSLIARSMLRAHAEGGEPLQGIVKQTNDLFCHDTKDSGNFVTAWVGTLNSQSGELTYASAGHMPAIWIRADGSLEELTTEGVALGVIEVEQVEVKTVTLPQGSQLLLYTDGVLDAQNEKGELFGKSRLIDYLKSASDFEPESLVAGLLEAIDEFTSGSEPYDDLTVLSVKRV